VAAYAEAAWNRTAQSSTSTAMVPARNNASIGDLPNP
jgi:hypothetical protein